MSPYSTMFHGLSGPKKLLVAFALGRKQAACMAVLALLTLATSGCSVVHNGYTMMTRNNSWNETVVVLRNRSFSAKAWHRRKHNFCKEQHQRDFCNGFRAGYEAVCGGADGCTPAFPPPEYLSWEFQSGEGQARTSAWFTGYPHGVRAAEEEGTANWHEIQMSAGTQAQFQDAGVMGQSKTLTPIPATPMQPTAPAQAYPVPAPALSGSAAQSHFTHGPTTGPRAVQGLGPTLE